MLTKNQTKRILSLSKKKQRSQEQMFVSEGVKVTQEFLDAQIMNLLRFFQQIRFMRSIPMLLFISVLKSFPNK